MAEDIKDISRLIAKWLEGSLNEEEQQALTEWRLSSVSNEHLFQQLTNKETLIPKLKALYEYDKEAEQRKLSYQVVPRSMMISLNRPGVWIKYVAAACILLMLLAGVWRFINKKEAKEPVVQQQPARFKNDVQPGGNNATLVLGDGTIINLNSAQNGTLAVAYNATIVKKDGELNYQKNIAKASVTKKHEIAYNILSTPKGGNYKLVLPDGSKVWLNAESTIRYPIAFMGSERKVEGSGELYFEIVKDPKKPFKVAIHPSPGGSGAAEIEVLGTHFNVNAYTNEEVIKTTLLEGKIKQTLIDNRQSVILTPRQQAQINGDKMNVVNDADIGETLAWVNNTFIFNDLTIRPLMRQLTRWYNVEVVYEEEVTTHFIATIPRTVPLSKVLQALEMTSGVHFEIDGKKIVVKK